MTYYRENKIVVLFTVLMMFIGIGIFNLTSTTVYAQTKIVYVTSGRDDSTEGQGTQEQPYQSFKYALQNANDGDTIKVIGNIIYSKDTGVPFNINKQVTIEGSEGISLVFRGMNVELSKDVTFKDITLNVRGEGGQNGKIYASDYHLTFDNVSTKLSDQQTHERPILFAGTSEGQNGGPGAVIDIIGNNNETHFEKIVGSNENTSKETSTTINIKSVNAKVINGIIFGESLVNGKVKVVSHSNSITSFFGGQAINNQLVLKNVVMANVNLVNIKDLILEDSRVSLSDSEENSIAGNFTSDATSELTLVSDMQKSFNNIEGSGKIIVPKREKITVRGNFDSDTTIEIDNNIGTVEEILDSDIIEIAGLIQGDLSLPKIVLQRPTADRLQVFPKYGTNVYTLRRAVDKVMLEIVTDTEGNGNEDDYEAVYTEFVDYIDEQPSSYYNLVKNSEHLNNQVVVNFEEPSIIQREGKTIQVTWVIRPVGKIHFTGQAQETDVLYTIERENNSQVVSYTITKPENGKYVTEDGSDFPEEKYGQKIVVENNDRFTTKTLRFEEVVPPAQKHNVTVISRYKTDEVERKVFTVVNHENIEYVVPIAPENVQWTYAVKNEQDLEQLKNITASKEVTIELVKYHPFGILVEATPIPIYDVNMTYELAGENVGTQILRVRKGENAIPTLPTPEVGEYSIHTDFDQSVFENITENKNINVRLTHTRPSLGLVLAKKKDTDAPNPPNEGGSVPTPPTDNGENDGNGNSGTPSTDPENNSKLVVKVLQNANPINYFVRSKSGEYEILFSSEVANGSRWEVYLHSDPILLGTVTVNDGKALLNISEEKANEFVVGDHKLILKNLDSNPNKIVEFSWKVISASNEVENNNIDTQVSPRKENNVGVKAENKLTGDKTNNVVLKVKENSLANTGVDTLVFFVIMVLFVTGVVTLRVKK